MKPEQLKELAAAWPGEWRVRYEGSAMQLVGDYHVAVDFLKSGPITSVVGPKFQFSYSAKTCLELRQKVAEHVADLESKVAMLRKLVGP